MFAVRKCKQIKFDKDLLPWINKIFFPAANLDTTPLMMEYDSAARDGGISLGNVKNFFAGFIASQIFGLLAIIFVSVWISKYLGGVGWSSATIIFNYHPLFMVLGMIFLYGDGKLVEFCNILIVLIVFVTF